ncbi:hypothetical protein BC833DRAFT_565129 [Globomyces pollinis-pini]|nr:hypothetical protein BC833DRAFT_565129 [Globomyces pollinis-pini]
MTSGDVLHDTFQSGIIQYENLYCVYDPAQEKPVLVANQYCKADGSTGLCAQRSRCYENALAPASKCYVCPAGKSCITISGGHNMNTCSIGNFARQGDGVCSKCPWGRTTIREGSTSESDCMCPVGSYTIQGTVDLQLLQTLVNVWRDLLVRHLEHTLSVQWVHSILSAKTSEVHVLLELSLTPLVLLATGGVVQNILYETGRDIWSVYFVDRIGTIK